MAQTLSQRQAKWYQNNKQVIKKKRIFKQRQTPEGYLKYVWKYYSTQLKAKGSFMPITKDEWVEHFLNDSDFEEQYTLFKASMFDKVQRPCISKVNSGDSWTFGNLKVEAYGKRNKPCETLNGDTLLGNMKKVNLNGKDVIKPEWL